MNEIKYKTVFIIYGEAFYDWHDLEPIEDRKVIREICIVADQKKAENIVFHCEKYLFGRENIVELTNQLGLKIIQTIDGFIRDHSNKAEHITFFKVDVPILIE